MLLSDQVAIITGGGRGVGRAIVERFAREGARVVVVDIDEEAGREAAKVAEAAGGEAFFRSADIAQRLDVHNLIAAADDAFGKIDILVNNAAVADETSFLELESSEFDRVFATNVRGAFLLGQGVAKHLIKRRQASAPEATDADAGSGAIVNVTSLSAHYGSAHHVAYSASNGALVQLTKSMALALAPHGIRVNAVAPGSVDSGMTDMLLADDEQRDKAVGRTPLQRFGRPEEIAAVAAWLASQEASYLTGTTIWADGGRMALNVINGDQRPSKKKTKTSVKTTA